MTSGMRKCKDCGTLFYSADKSITKCYNCDVACEECGDRGEILCPTCGGVYLKLSKVIGEESVKAVCPDCVKGRIRCPYCG